MEISLFSEYFPDIQEDIISTLSIDGWLYKDKRVYLHPVIAETVRNWLWSADKVTVMEYHKKIIDIYVGMANAVQIKEILREADSFRSMHNHHIIRAMYFDMLGCYYDTLLDGAYYPENAKEAEMLEKLLENMGYAISEMQLSTDRRREKYLTQYCLSMASVLLRSEHDSENYTEVSELLDIAKEFIIENSAEHCYYCMTLAWYFTLAEPDIERTQEFTEQAERIAKQVFPTDLEIIDTIHIPTANCFYFHNDFRLSADKIEEAVEICRNYPDMMPYIDKQAELLNILLDIYLAMDDKAKCHELIAEIDLLNKTYKEQGVCREVSPDIRNQL